MSFLSCLCFQPNEKHSKSVTVTYKREVAPGANSFRQAGPGSDAHNQSAHPQKHEDELEHENSQSGARTSAALLKLPPGAPRFSELYANLSHIRGSWHARGGAAMSVLAQQLGAQLAVLWALSSDGAFFVAQASAGPRQAALRPGSALPAALGDRQHNSLQRVQASKAATTYTCVDPDLRVNLQSACQGLVQGSAGPVYGGCCGGPQPFGRLPYDLAELVERCGTASPAANGALRGSSAARAAGAGVTDFAVLPLISGGEVVGAVTLALHRCCLPLQHCGNRSRSGGGSGTTAAIPPPPAAMAKGAADGCQQSAPAPVIAPTASLGGAPLPQLKAQHSSRLSGLSVPAAVAAAAGGGSGGGSPAGHDGSGSKRRLVIAAAAGAISAAASPNSGGPRHLPGTAGGGGVGGGVVEQSGSSVTDRIRRAFSRTDRSELNAAGGTTSASASVSAAARGTTDADAAPSPKPLPAFSWLHSAACVYQLSQLAHFLGYGFFSDTEQSSFVAQSCSLVSGVAAAPDVQALVNCLIGTTKGIIYQRFRLQAHVLVALVHSSGTTAAYFKQQRQPRASIARTLAVHPGGAGGPAGAGGGAAAPYNGSHFPLAGVSAHHLGGGAGVGGMAGVGLYGGGSDLAGGRAHSQRDMSSQQRLYTMGGNHAAAAAAAAAQALYGGVSGGAGGGSAVGSGVGDAAMGPAMQALLQANFSNTSTGGGDAGASPTGGAGVSDVAGNTVATAPIHGGGGGGAGGGPGTGGGGGRGGGVSGGLFNLSAALLGRKTRSQSQLRSARSVPLQVDADGIAGYASETYGASVTATIISLSHTLLADALAATPPAGTAVRSCAEALARDAAPIRDISLASRLVADVRPGPGGLPADDSSVYGLTGGGGGGGGMVSPSTSFLRRGSACGMGAGTAGGGRHAALGSLVIALGLGCSSTHSDGMAPGVFGGFSDSIPPAAALSGVSNSRMSIDPGTGRPSHSSYYHGGMALQHTQFYGMGGPQRTSAASTGLGAVSGMLVGPMGGHPVSGCIEESGEANVQAGPGAGAVGGTGLQAAPQALPPASEPHLALYVAFREVLQEPILDKLLDEVTQMVELVAPSVQQRLLVALRPEWAAMHSRLLNPAAFIGGQSQLSVAGGGLSAALGPGAAGAGGGGSAPSASNSRRGQQPSSHDWTEALGTGELWPAGGGSGALSFALEEPAPLSHLQVLVNSFHSTLSSIQVERALEEAGGVDSPVAANDMRGVELLQQIGRGGQGVVYRGRMHGVPVAVKVIPTAEGGGGAGPGDRDVAYERDKPEAVQRAARRQRALLRDALEVAATAALSHPNLVQLHTYFTDVMVVEYEGDMPGRYRLMHVAESVPGDPTGAVNLVLVLEYCDGGNLRQAMERGVFFRRERLPSPAHLPAARAEAAGAGGAAAALAAAAELAPNFEFIYLTLLEIALAVRHMHALRLAHCDVKPSNVLLRAAPHDPRGFTCKLSDFGCVQLLREMPGGGSGVSSTGMLAVAGAGGGGGGGAVSSTVEGQQPVPHLGQQQASQRSLGGATAAAAAALSGGDAACASGAAGPAAARLGFMSGHVLGTPSHLAPEAFLPGNLLDGSVDIYSFGMLMWEVLVGIPALAGLSAARVHSYTSRGLRPQFPPNTPDHYRNLAHLCWAQDPRKRPTASALVMALHKALMQVSPGAAMDVRSLVADASLPVQQQQQHAAVTAAHLHHRGSGGGGHSPHGGSGAGGSGLGAAASMHHSFSHQTHPHPFGRLPTSPEVVSANASEGAGSRSRVLHRPSSLGRGAVSSAFSAAAAVAAHDSAAAAAAATCNAPLSSAAGVPVSAGSPVSPAGSTMNAAAANLISRRHSIGERRRSQAAYTYGGGNGAGGTGAGGGGATSPGGGSGAPSVPATLSALQGRGGSASGSSPLLLQLAQSRMSRSSRTPDALAGGGGGMWSAAGAPVAAAGSMPAAGTGTGVGPDAGAVSSDRPGGGSMLPLSMTSPSLRGGGGGRAVGGTGGNYGGAAAVVAAVAQLPLQPNGSISFGGSGAGSAAGVGMGGGALSTLHSGIHSGHVTEACLATAADMVDVAAASSAAAAAADGVNGFGRAAVEAPRDGHATGPSAGSQAQALGASAVAGPDAEVITAESNASFYSTSNNMLSPTATDPCPAAAADTQGVSGGAGGPLAGSGGGGGVSSPPVTTDGISTSRLADLLLGEGGGSGGGGGGVVFGGGGGGGEGEGVGAPERRPGQG